jgi:hypothetical protein
MEESLKSTYIPAPICDLQSANFIYRIGDYDIERAALSTLQEAEKLLIPLDPLAHELIKVKPTYSATFVFAEDGGDVCLRKEWKEEQDEGSAATSFEDISTKWTRLERDSGRPAPIVDVCYSDLQTGFGWHFDLHAEQSVESARIPEKLSEFAHTVKILPDAARNRTFDRLFVQYRPYAGHLKKIQQSISYRYLISHSDYVVELSRYQDRELAPRRTVLSAPEKETTVYEPRWGLSVYRPDWDKEFTRNENLGIGERADWVDDVEEWFPEDINKDSDTESSGKLGFSQLLAKLKEIQNLMIQAKDQDLLKL